MTNQDKVLCEKCHDPTMASYPVTYHGMRDMHLCLVCGAEVNKIIEALWLASRKPIEAIQAKYYQDLVTALKEWIGD